MLRSTPGQEHAASYLHACLNKVRSNLPVVDRTLARYGHLSLLDYLKSLEAAVEPPLQDRGPLLRLVHDYVFPLLGEAAAKGVADDLAAHPLVLTTSHHGVDFYAQTLQSRLILALRNTSGLSPARTVPVFACGNIPLNNLTYPRGMLLYRLAAGSYEAAPRRLPLFPERLKRTMVSVAPAWDSVMIDQARARLAKMIRQGAAVTEIALAARTLLNEDYTAAALESFSDYSQQAVVVNRRLWKRLFARGLDPPEMIHLELEKIASALLGLDLADPLSLARGVLFDGVLREPVLAALDGVRGCWNRVMLGQRSGTTPRNVMGTGGGRPCGTVFFWGVDPGGRRIPLDLQTKASGKIVLRGRDDAGGVEEVSWSPHEIADAVQNQRLIPSLFTSFLVIAFARGVCCIGGYFQGEYLPTMQRGLFAALEKARGYGDAARSVLQVPTALYLDGMAAVMSRTGDGGLLPAGPLEIIAGGGLTEEDLNRMGSLTVTEAHLADLAETLPEAAPPEARTDGWQQRLAAASSRVLEEKVAIL